MKTWQLCIIILGYALYVVVGGFIFMALEKEPGEDSDSTSNLILKNWLDNNTCVSHEDLRRLLQAISRSELRGRLPSNITGNDEAAWNAYTSIYFAVTVVTTIGYGNISPVTTGGRVFCIFYALIGIPIALIMFAEIGRKLAKAFTAIDNWCLDKCCQPCQKQPKLTKFFRFTFIHAVFAVLLMFIPAVIFNVVEKDWSIGTGIYYSFITLTTIGFGDYAAGIDENSWGKPVYRLMVSVWIVIGLAWMSSLIAITQEHIGDIFAILTKKKKSENIHQASQIQLKGDTNGNQMKPHDHEMKQVV